MGLRSEWPLAVIQRSASRLALVALLGGLIFPGNAKERPAKGAPSPSAPAWPISRKPNQTKPVTDEQVKQCVREGETALRAKDFTTAIDRFQRAAEARPTEWKRIEALMNAWIQSGRLLGAKELKMYLSERSRKRFWNSLTPDYARAVELNDMGLAYESLEMSAQAVSCYEAALVIQRRIKNQVEESQTLQNLSKSLSRLFRREEALKAAIDAVAIRRTLKHSENVAFFLQAVGLRSAELGRYPEAMKAFEEALEIWTRSGNEKGRGDALLFMAQTLGAMGRPAESIRRSEEALAAVRKVRNRETESDILIELSDTRLSNGDLKGALESATQGLVVARALGDRRREMGGLSYQAIILGRLRRFDEATAQFELLLRGSREIRYAMGETVGLFGLAGTQRDRGRPAEALRYLQQAAALEQARHNPVNTALAFRMIGAILTDQKRFDEAQSYLDRACQLIRASGDRRNEFAILLEAANVLLFRANYEEGLDRQRRALALARALGDHTSSARALSLIGYTLEALCRYEEAAMSFREAVAEWKVPAATNPKAATTNASGAVLTALKLERNAADTGQAEAIRVRGVVSERLGNHGDAMQAYEQALTLAIRGGNRVEEANVRSKLAGLYGSFGLHEKSLKMHELAVKLARQSTNRLDLAPALNNLAVEQSLGGQYETAVGTLKEAIAIDPDLFVYPANLGRAYKGLGQLDEARGQYNLALEKSRAARNRRAEISIQSYIAGMEMDAGNLDAARTLLQQILVEAHQIKLREVEADALDGLADIEARSGRPALAIFWGKQAVNIFQSMRGGLVALDREVQKSFVTSRGQAYRRLAEQLVAEGRLPEAEQVLRLLKEEEFFDFVRRDPKVESAHGVVPVTPAEADSLRRYREMAEEVGKVGLRWGELRRKTREKRSAAEEAEYQTLEGKLQAANERFQTFFRGLEQEFGGARPGRIEQVKEVQGLQRRLVKLREDGAGESAVVYTLVGEKAFHAIVLTPAARQSFKTEIRFADFNKKVADFRSLLRDSRSDAIPAAQELYRIITCDGAVDRALQGASSKTVMWFLDGPLRYIPVGALHDGQGWFVERYRNVVITPASLDRLGDAPAAAWEGLGVGVSQPHITQVERANGEALRKRFAALTAVPSELRSIIRDAPHGGEGVIPGRILLDRDFTTATLRDALEHRFRLVHIASHFSLEAGDEAASFLLLGDGKALSLAQFKTWPSSLEDVDLLTLSACDTAVGAAGADGREVDCLGEIAQQRGAAAVIASLWSVSDASTAVLMKRFYNARESTPTSKAAAIQAAQLALLRGEDVATATAGPGRNPPRNFAHPYYWAPFILIGNWR